MSSSFVSGYLISKKKHLPKNVDGDLYLNYDEDENNPSLYLSANPSILKNSSGYAILKMTIMHANKSHTIMNDKLLRRK